MRSRSARFSSSLAPHSLQNRARRWFLLRHLGQWSANLRDGMATNRPDAPSITLMSRMTKDPSRVTLQTALSRSFALLVSFTRVSEISMARHSSRSVPSTR